MTIKPETLGVGERMIIGLRQLYQSYGYKQYKVSKFEEYDLYMENKKFLMSEQVLTFSDMNGKLMALKPDITLSIIKNTRDDERLRKLCYNETVYRVPRNAYGFREIMQTGLECIGEIDAYAAAEVLMLAARSLEEISGDYVLDISDMGIISALLTQVQLPEDARREILVAVGEKNPHGLGLVCSHYGVSEKDEKLLSALISTYGPLEETLEKVEKLELPAACREVI
ncbi:MAG: ATP phosphoribosyltransferase regulatory subunit, partial [Oscillospiraceae bacterium]|nr:ATP phosphoribosyltransferase regulatory subunit [Oscillospiraceae bacterium]